MTRLEEAVHSPATGRSIWRTPWSSGVKTVRNMTGLNGLPVKRKVRIARRVRASARKLQFRSAGAALRCCAHAPILKPTLMSGAEYREEGVPVCNPVQW